MTAQLYSFAERREARSQAAAARQRLAQQVDVAWGAFHIAHAMWTQQPHPETYLLRKLAYDTFTALSDRLDGTPPKGAA